MLTFEEFLEGQLKNPEFKKEWDALAPEREETLKKLRAENEKRLRKNAVKISDEVSVALAR